MYIVAIVNTLLDKTNPYNGKTDWKAGQQGYYSLIYKAEVYISGYRFVNYNMGITQSASSRTYILGGADAQSQGLSPTAIKIKEETNGTLYNVTWDNYRSLPDKVADDIIAGYTSGQIVELYG
jgi:hypothetical protein